jgi:molybdate transport system substrate-binding protein
MQGIISMIKMRTLLLVVLSILVLTTAGCRDSNSESEPIAMELLCGSSFIKPSQQLIAEFNAETGHTILMTAAGSEDFLPLIKAGEKGDIIVTHDPFLDYIKDAGKLQDHVHTGFIAPVITVQKGNPKNIKSLEDLTQPGLKIALSNPEYSTCGEMVFALLEKKGLKEAVMKNVENRLTKGHSTLGNLVKTQSVDAVIMWNGVANTFGDDLEIVPTPYEYDTEIRVHVIGLNYTKLPETLKLFMEFAKKRGPEIFEANGYVK